MNTKYLIADIETTSLDIHSKILCICARELYKSNVEVFYTAQEFIEYAKDYDYVVFHNGCRFDIRVLFLYGFRNRIRDTLIDSKIVFPKEILLGLDSSNQYYIPKNLIGSYSLKAFGYRLGILKGEVTDFSKTTEELIEYCKQDVRITEHLFRKILNHPLIPNYLTLHTEYITAYLMANQELYGIYFDKEKALDLYSSMKTEIDSLEAKLQKKFGYYTKICKVVENPAKTKRNPNDNDIPNLVVGPYTKFKSEIINIGSRKQLIDKLLLEGFKADTYTAKGSIVLDEEVFLKNELTDLARYYKLKKDIGQLYTGENSLLGLVDENNRLHGYVDYLSCSTHRASHSRPNISQIPKTKEFRELFIPPKDKILIGIDADALELMMLGYYLYKFGNKEYIKSVATGTKSDGNDIHTLTQKQIGLETRNQAKTLAYAMLYGAGDLKIGLNLGSVPDSFEYTQKEFDKTESNLLKKCIKKDNKLLFPISKTNMIEYNRELVLYALYGADVKQKYLERTKGLQELLKELKIQLASFNAIKSLDNRLIRCSSQHKLLNFLLQSSGAIFMKYYLVDTFMYLSKKLYLNKDFAYVANIHDAIAIETTEEHSSFVCFELEESFRRVSTKFKFPYPVSGEAIKGKDLYEIFI